MNLAKLNIVQLGDLKERCKLRQWGLGLSPSCCHILHNCSVNTSSGACYIALLSQNQKP